MSWKVKCSSPTIQFTTKDNGYYCSTVSELDDHSTSLIVTCAKQWQLMSETVQRSLINGRLRPNSITLSDRRHGPKLVADLQQAGSELARASRSATGLRPASDLSATRIA